MLNPPITHDELWQILDDYREHEAMRIGEQLSNRRFVGLRGDAGVGKTRLLRRVLVRRQMRNIGHVGAVDLDGAWGVGRTAWLFFHAAATALVGPMAMSHLVAGLDEGLMPARSRRARFDIFNLLADERLVDAVLNRTTLEDDETLLPQAINVFGQLEDTVLAIDHLEAPGLPPRHPVDLDHLLWQIRSVHQRNPTLRVCLCGRSEAADHVRSEDAAFYNDGIWLTITPPGADVWQHVARAAWRKPNNRRLESILELTEGQPASTIALLARDTSISIADVIAQTTDAFATTADRTVQHARSLHRLGAHLLMVIARNERPYSAVPGGRAEVTRALAALRAAGLVSKRGRGEWRLTEPLVAIALARPELDLLRGELEPPTDEPSDTLPIDIFVRDPQVP